MSPEERKAYRRRYYLAHQEAAKAAAREAYARNKEKRDAQNRAWYERNRAEQITRGTERNRRWAAENQDKARAKGRETMRRRRLNAPAAVASAKARDYEKNKEKRLATVKNWRKRNPERVNALAIKAAYVRRTRLENVVVEHVERLVVFERDGWMCGICRLPVAKVDASIDHVIPVAKGGSHTYENCQTAHLKCNISKGAKIQERAA